MNYEFDKILGTGHFGDVKLATHKVTGAKVAIKILNYRQGSKNEITIMQTLKNACFRNTEGSKNIIFLLETIEMPKSILLVMEYMEGGDLFDYVCDHGKLTDSKSKQVFKQIVSAVSFCHYNKVVHRDIKLENILLDKESNIKLADFGLSEIVEDGQFLKTQCGSPRYSAPEIVKGQLYIGQEVDIWSLGVCLYTILHGYLPFEDENEKNLYAKINLGNFYLESFLSDQVQDLLKKILVVDATKRIKLSEIKKHEWLNS